MLEKLLTKYILVSRPVFKKAVGYVYYALFCFFKTVTKSYFEKDFCVKNKAVPVIKTSEWLRTRKYRYINLIKEVGSPLYEYEAGKLKMKYCNTMCVTKFFFSLNYKSK